MSSAAEMCRACLLIHKILVNTFRESFPKQASPRKYYVLVSVLRKSHHPDELSENLESLALREDLTRQPCHPPRRGRTYCTSKLSSERRHGVQDSPNCSAPRLTLPGNFPRRWLQDRRCVADMRLRRMEYVLTLNAHLALRIPIGFVIAKHSVSVSAFL